MIEVLALSGISLHTIVFRNSPVWDISHEPVIHHISEMVQDKKKWHKKLSYRKETVRLLHNIEIRVLH